MHTTLLFEFSPANQTTFELLRKVALLNDLAQERDQQCMFGREARQQVQRLTTVAKVLGCVITSQAKAKVGEFVTRLSQSNEMSFDDTLTNYTINTILTYVHEILIWCS